MFIIIANYYHLTLGGQVMKLKLPKLLTLIIATSFLFISCNNNVDSNKTNEDTLNIVTSFYESVNGALKTLRTC